MRVYIDSREKEMIQRVLKYYRKNKIKYPYIESIKIKKLITGDIVTADGLFGCERKSSSDFISSIITRKLKQQLFELRQNYKIPILVVEEYEGIMDCINKNPNIHPNVIKGVVTSAISHNGVPIQFVGPFYISFVLETINKLYDGEKEYYETEDYTPIRRSTTKNEHKLNIVMGLPDIKDVLAKSLLSHFNNSIREIANADEEELMRIKGIGKNKAQKIVEILK